MIEPNDDDEVTRRRKALNAVRLVCLGRETYDFAAKTFGLKPVEIRVAEAMLGHWLAMGGQWASDEEKVAYLLSAGWPRRPPTPFTGGLAGPCANVCGQEATTSGSMFAPAEERT